MHGVTPENEKRKELEKQENSDLLRLKKGALDEVSFQFFCQRGCAGLDLGTGPGRKLLQETIIRLDPECLPGLNRLLIGKHIDASSVALEAFFSDAFASAVKDYFSRPPVDTTGSGHRSNQIIFRMKEPSEVREEVDSFYRSCFTHFLSGSTEIGSQFYHKREQLKSGFREMGFPEMDIFGLENLEEVTDRALKGDKAARSFLFEAGDKRSASGLIKFILRGDQNFFLALGGILALEDSLARPILHNLKNRSELRGNSDKAMCLRSALNVLSTHTEESDRQKVYGHLARKLRIDAAEILPDKTLSTQFPHRRRENFDSLMYVGEQLGMNLSPKLYNFLTTPRRLAQAMFFYSHRVEARKQKFNPLAQEDGD